ncbi:type II toxin-antitoxin system VapC family toxin [Mucilaginibacter sp.]|jgi:tRNA(fMet)-specific endonuclease VapC|uniref:type II toxin-antitoxin system VapC family toxin n=1 Tax=Mucilaginibacter sp. TaxID=1882438 RepID=UPI002CDDCF8D|nr:type II toxin-antitoxin system VapC family toxin [Mucilaginibacter sp.]HTI59719.1 type II toxin-antitoxin system VapC family toxin [Mucilaginibacter sp.]
MNILLDTNILFHLSKEYSVQLLSEIINPDSRTVYTSVVSIAELKSIGIQNNWGARKWKIVNAALDKINAVELNENLISTYAEIDAFSQRKNPAYDSYSFATPRNMGKNDLWIAATAALLGLKLITTDADFNHLDGVFIEVQHLKPESLIK